MRTWQQTAEEDTGIVRLTIKKNVIIKLPNTVS